MRPSIAAFVLTFLGVVRGFGEDTADIILANGRVYTLEDSRAWAEAVAVKGERILAVGSTEDMRRFKGSATREIDLAGAFVSPGFNDSHVHVDGTGALLTGVNLLDVHEPNAFRDRIRATAERLPKGSWITRGMWGAYEQWQAGSSGESASSEKASGPFTPDRSLIDAATPEHPVLVSRFDRSLHLANSLALKLASIHESTLSPPEGEIVKDASGRLTGILKGKAVDLVEKVIPPISFEQRLTQVRAVLKEAREGGVTTVQDLTSPEQLMAYQRLREEGELTVRIMLRPNIFQAEHVAALGLSRGFGGDWLKLIGYKGWVDGIMGSSGAMFFTDYDHHPGNRGYLRPPMLPESVEGAAFKLGSSDHYTDYPPGKMEQLIKEWLPTGVPPHIHAIGDLGNRILLDIYERVLTEAGLVDSDHRWRVIHAQVVHPDDFARFGKLNLIAEVNPYHVSDDMRWMEERIGKERSLGAYAFRKLKDSGAKIIFGSDSPGTNAARYFLSPVYGLYAAVSRKTLIGEPKEGWYPDQMLTIEEAIEAYTRGPAWASFEEDIKGTLAPGKLADIAVFDTNLVEAGRSDPGKLLEAKVLYTLVGGKIVFERGAR
ncbi:MAG: amidohydrolase [Vicinamibacteria bacterium]